MPQLIKYLLIDSLNKAITKAISKSLIPLKTIPEIVLERPARIEHGDFATNLPLRLSKSTRMSPMEIATLLAQLIPNLEEVESITVAKPGFINFTLSQEWIQKQVHLILAEGERFGNIQPPASRKILVEFVSVNPTGPVHVGHTRGAVLGSALSTILEAAGHSVTREYYVNDAGTQMTLFYQSVLARYLQSLGYEEEVPKGGYSGSYISELSQQILSEEGERFVHLSKPEAIKEIGDIARNLMLNDIKEALKKLRVDFDSWFKEQSLFENKEYDEAVNLLQNRGYTIQRDGALWFTSSALGDDKDNVLVRSSGLPTYFASDIAYHHNKLKKRGFDQAINIWGADHQGHVNRMKAALTALGINPGKLDILISQMVTLKRGESLMKISKRAGEFVTLSELVDEVGPDACRFFFLSRAPSTQMDFDLDLATTESSENPVYYIQYGLARVNSILDKAIESNLDWNHGEISLLKDPTELSLIKQMLMLPELVEKVSNTLEPHHIAHYSLELATAFHWFYENCRVLSNIPSDISITLARLKLVAATRIVLTRTLKLMGMSTPERM
ncbi:arginine--tRNA ligase [SAR202 cluster bacterium AC-409-J13_OGT_754m]|nr:arginine--tRNA ligase [SAR202 cluster bacterium AC-409-J13_OGT_754m]